PRPSHLRPGAPPAARQRKPCLQGLPSALSRPSRARHGGRVRAQKSRQRTEDLKSVERYSPCKRTPQPRLTGPVPSAGPLFLLALIFGITFRSLYAPSIDLPERHTE